jgi:septum formation protein
MVCRLSGSALSVSVVQAAGSPRKKGISYLQQYYETDHAGRDHVFHPGLFHYPQIYTLMLHEKLKDYNIILGSGSPRRQFLLDGLGIEYEIRVNNDLEETYPAGLSKQEIPVYLAELKSRTIMEAVPPDTLLITADTIVWLEDRVINKPKDRADAVNILNKLSGNMHEVITGVCIRTTDRMHSFHASSLVWFTRLSEEEINYYIEQYKPFDKAGAYGVQEWIGYIGIEKIEGSYFNVMGLPIQKVYHELKELLEE